MEARLLTMSWLADWEVFCSLLVDLAACLALVFGWARGACLDSSFCPSVSQLTARLQPVTRRREADTALIWLWFCRVGGTKACIAWASGAPLASLHASAARRLARRWTRFRPGPVRSVTEPRVFCAAANRRRKRASIPSDSEGEKKKGVCQSAAACNSVPAGNHSLLPASRHL